MRMPLNETMVGYSLMRQFSVLSCSVKALLVHISFFPGGAPSSGQTHREGLAKALDSPMERQSSNAMGWALEATSVNTDMRHPEDVINPSPAKMLPSLPTHTPNRTGSLCLLLIAMYSLFVRVFLQYTPRLV